MGILDELLGGGQTQKNYRDFINRYEQGAPSEGCSDQEVLERYGEVSHAVPPDQYAQAAQEALAKLSPEERAAFLKMLLERAAAKGVTLPRQMGPEPKELGEVLTDLHEKPGSVPGYSRRSQRPASGANGRVEPDHRHTVVPDGQGRARGRRSYGGQARHASVLNGVVVCVWPAWVEDHAAFPVGRTLRL